jgi:uncharacterized membrane protein
MSAWLRNNPTVAWIRFLVVGLLVVLIGYELATPPVDAFQVVLGVGVLLLVGSYRWFRSFRDVRRG